MENALRVFWAIQPPKRVRDALVEAQGNLKALVDQPVKWVVPENLHLTLKFISSLRSDQIAKLIAQTESKLAASTAFDAALSGFGAFPNARQANVLWFGMSKGASLTAKLARKIDAAASKLDVASETQPFRAHVTLGRLSEPRSVRIDQAIPIKEQSFPVEEVVLFQSQLSSTGSVYTPLARISLGDPEAESVEFVPEM